MNLWEARDPRAKTYFALMSSLSLVLVPAAEAWMFLPAIVACLLSVGIPRNQWLALLRAVLILWFLSFLSNAFLIRGTRVGPERLGWARPTLEGMGAGLAHGARLAGLAGLGAWLAASTSVLDLTASLEWSARKIPALRRSLHRALFPIVLAVRLVPLLIEEARRLLEVERLRHGPLGRGRQVVRLSRLAPLWMVLVVERAEALAVALTLSGYDPERPRGFSRVFRLGLADWGLILLGTLALVLGVER